LALDEPGQAAAIGAGGDLGAKGLEMFAHDPMEDGRPSQWHAARRAGSNPAIPRRTTSRIATQPATRGCDGRLEQALHSRTRTAAQAL